MGRRTIAAGVLLVAIGAGAQAGALEGQDQESRVLSDRFDVSLGWYGTDFSTDVAVGFEGILGTLIRFEDELGLEEKQDVFRLEGHWRFSRRSAIYFGYVQFDRSGRRTIDEPIDFENLRFTGELDTIFDQKLANLGYRFSFYNNGKMEAGISAGFSIYEFTAGVAGNAELLDGNGDVIVGTGELRSATERITAPVPTFGIFLNYAVTPKLIFRYSGSFFNFDSSDFEARLTDSAGSIQWFFVRNVSIGGGVSSTRVRVADFGRSRPYEVDYRYSGFRVFFGFVF